VYACYLCPVIAETAGLRQRKKARQREQILQAGLELFRERGYPGASVQEIARRAEISLPTFYNYFPSKDALLSEFAMTGWAPALRAVLGASGTVAHRLRRFFRAVAERVTVDRELWLALAVSNVYNPVRDPEVLSSETAATRLLEALIAEGQRRGELTGKFTAVRLASVLEGIMLRACIEWGASFPQVHDLGGSLSESLDFFLRGASNPKR
jgi:AcrR family transcriptional regulator